ncbi:hypothetical protein LG943_12615 [Streptomonospora sp. S1-112]|uniref:Uncharacterized protein n=1 Tax=Streptomonospora mangrovi TaxID=2883123 RepID=A0A9X3SNF6_9ACTN|nr:hypothetical protein [Streptomonospora mangrovi]MDA0565151.1 hypothetical protein [Streptomonospora mangrovi]
MDGSAFSTLRRSFRLLADGPRPPVLDLRGVAGTASRMTAGDLDGWLVQAPQETADAVWRRLLVPVRGGDATWTVVAAGLALPGLCAARTRLRCDDADRADIEAEMLAAFVAAMRSADPAPERVCGRLVSAARAAGQRHQRALRRLRSREVPWECAGLRHAGQSGAGPVTLLARALRTGVLSPIEAELIARTHLERRPLIRVADELGLAYITARRYRRSAQGRLLAALGGVETTSRVSAIGTSRAVS